jgi:hypothetical protein
MREKTMKKYHAFPSAGHGASGLKLAVQLAVSQLDQGIGLAEAVQFAAKYHNVTCAAIESELSKKRPRSFR